MAEDASMTSKTRKPVSSGPRKQEPGSGGRPPVARPPEPLVVPSKPKGGGPTGKN